MLSDQCVTNKNPQHLYVLISIAHLIWSRKWVSDCCLTNANSAIFQLWWEQVHFQWDDDDVHFVLDQHTKLDFYSASLLKQQSVERHFAPRRHIILIQSQPVTTESNLAWMVLWWSPFKMASQQPSTPFKMAVVAKYLFSCPLLLYYKSKWAQILITATWQWVV
jgi:hypothetical protein